LTTKSISPMKNICLSVFVSFFGLSAFAQGLTQLNWLKPEELRALTKREIVLVNYSEPENENKALQKRADKAKGEKLQELNDRMAVNRNTTDFMEANYARIVTEHWTHGKMDKLRTITHEEAKANVKNKSGSKYALLMLRSFTKQMSIYDGTGIDKIELVAFTFQGGEDYGKNTELIAFPLLVSKGVGIMTEADLSTTVKILNRYVEMAAKSAKKLDTENFVEDEVTANCSTKKTTKLYFHSGYFKDAGAADVKSGWPSDVETVKDGEFFEAYTPTAEDGFAIFLPANVLEGQIAFISTQALLLSRIVVQPSTGKILGYAKTKMGEKAGEMFYKKNHIESVSGCGK